MTSRKLFPERREMFGEFEVVSFRHASAEVEELRARKSLDVDTVLRWADLDHVRDDALVSLYRKANSGRWNPQSDVEWDTPQNDADWMLAPDYSHLAIGVRLARGSEATQRAAAFDELRFMLSQLLHGEQAALILCSQLTTTCERIDEKVFAAAQTADEARHIDALSNFLVRVAGGIDPVAPTTKAILDSLLATRSVPERVLGMQVLFEGVALGMMARIAEASPNKVLRQILRFVALDESRHAAFGALFMRRHIKTADEETRAALEDYAFNVLEALNANQRLDLLEALAPRYGLDPRRLLRWSLRVPRFAERNAPVYTHTVVPNLTALGLISAHTRERYRALGIIAGEA